MDRRYDPRNVFTAMHQKVTGDLLHLMDGFYCNIEDGLFELAYRHEDQQLQRRSFDLMRQMRQRRSGLIQSFAQRMQQESEGWFATLRTDHGLPPEGTFLAAKMAEKCSAHFRGLLQMLAERAAYGTNRDMVPQQLPIGPYRIALCFVASCRSLEFESQSVEIVQELFARFVLDRMGSIYGECNSRLEEAGFYTCSEVEFASSA